MRVAQLVIAAIAQPSIDVVVELDNTERGRWWLWVNRYSITVLILKKWRITMSHFRMGIFTGLGLIGLFTACGGNEPTPEPNAKKPLKTEAPEPAVEAPPEAVQQPLEGGPYPVYWSLRRGFGRGVTESQILDPLALKSGERPRAVGKPHGLKTVILMFFTRPFHTTMAF